MAISFKGVHFPKEVILMGVRWYLAYPLSTRPVEELMEERGVEVDHATTIAGSSNTARNSRRRSADGSEANAAAIRSYNKEHGTTIMIRQVKYLHNIVEQDHRAVKRVTRPMLGFKAFEAATARSSASNSCI